LENGTVEIYSRNAECTTGKFPDVSTAIGRYSFFGLSAF
jgi:ATP-dependent DNA ligase